MDIMFISWVRTESSLYRLSTVFELDQLAL